MGVGYFTRQLFENLARMSISEVQIDSKQTFL